jgi:hypothetical protein
MARFITGLGLSLMDTHTGLAPRTLRDIRAGQNAGGFAALDADVALCAAAGGLIGLLRLGQDHPERMHVSSELTASAWQALLAEAGITKGRPAARCKAHGRDDAGGPACRHTRDPANPRPGHHYSDLHRPRTHEAAGLMGKALWPEASQVQLELQPGGWQLIMQMARTRKSQAGGRLGLKPRTHGLKVGWTSGAVDNRRQPFAAVSLRATGHKAGDNKH